MAVRSLALLAAAWLLGTGASIGLARAIDTADGWPVLGLVIVGAFGGVVIVVVLWQRHTPIPPGDESQYRSTVAIKLAAAGTIAVVALLLAVVAGPWWLSVVGAVLSVIALVLSWPSAADRERHELLYLV